MKKLTLAPFCVISFSDPAMKPIETQGQDEIRRALQYRFGA